MPKNKTVYETSECGKPELQSDSHLRADLKFATINLEVKILKKTKIFRSHIFKASKLTTDDTRWIIWICLLVV